MVYGNTVNISEVPTILEPILNDTIIDTSFMAGCTKMFTDVIGLTINISVSQNKQKSLKVSE